jgi:RNA polymerase sigma factor (sigma-70 family)
VPQEGVAIARRRRVEERFSDVFEQYGSRARQLALPLCGDLEAADDLTQEAFVRLFATFRHLRHPEAAWPYLSKTIVNLGRSRARRAVIERAYLQRQRPPGTVKVDEPFDDRLFAALTMLPYRQRVALVLRFCEDLSEQAVAEVLDTSPKAVNGLVNRALASLRERLGEEPDE